MILHDYNCDSITSGELLLFRTIWHNTSDNMFIVKIDNNGDLISESCNNALENCFGLDKGQADGVKLKDILDEDAFKRIEQNYIECISFNKPVTYDETVVIDNSGKRYFNTTILPIIDESNQTRIFGISREYTELIKKEKEKLHIEKLKNTQMSQMIEDIAHQWRQPLSMISTLASTLIVNKELGVKNEHEDTDLLNEILDKTQYLSDTIDKISHILQRQSGQTVVVLQDKLHHFTQELKTSLEKHDIELHINISSDEPVHIEVINGELIDAIKHIVNNSIEALLKNQTQNRTIKICLSNSNNNALITIEDNGGGICEDILPNICELYYTTKHKSMGTGLGLFMSKNIIEKHHNGKLEISNSSNGAICTITLPMT